MRNLKYCVLSLAILLFVLPSCWKIDEGGSLELEPIEVVAASDTINANLGVELKYEGLTVKSGLDVKFEWTYGQPADGKTIADHLFKPGTVEKFSTSPTIDYTFSKIGTFLLRLRLDNGESVSYKYFTLNVNSGYDEGVAILSNDKAGNGSLTFVKTLTSEESAAGEREVFPDVFSSINPGQTLKNGVALFMSNATVKKVDYSGILIATNDERSTMWHMEAKTFQLFQKAGMAGAGSSFKAFGGEIANTSGFAAFLLGNNSHIYRYDMLLGNYTDMTDIKPMTRVFGGLSRTMPTTESVRTTIYYTDDTLCIRRSASAGVFYYSQEGYSVVNMATMRTSKNNGLYILFRNNANPENYLIRCTDGVGGIGTFKKWGASVDFTTSDLKMDENSKFVNTKHSADVYYTFGNAIYRWSLISAPATKPTITLPAGEQIRDIATNFKGRGKGNDGEDLLYVVTYNPSRAGDKKGSLYVYSFSDDSLVRSYEGICDDPVSVLYKYRVN